MGATRETTRETTSVKARTRPFISAMRKASSVPAEIQINPRACGPARPEPRRTEHARIRGSSRRTGSRPRSVRGRLRSVRREGSGYFGTAIQMRLESTTSWMTMKGITPRYIAVVGISDGVTPLR